MRDPSRIDGMLREIGWHWKRMPDLRLGQLLINAYDVNATIPDHDIYNVEDDALLEMVREMHERVESDENG